MLKNLISQAVRRRPAIHALALRLRDRLGVAPREAEYNLIPLLCDPTATAIDVGANVGSVTKILIRAASRVIAVEPIPELVQLLRTRFRREVTGKKLTIAHCVLSDHEGNSELFIPEHATGLASVEVRGDPRSGRTISVRTQTLDGLTKQKVGFVKIDVEGHECTVVAGGMELFAREKPVLLIESEERHRPGSLKTLTEMLTKLDYEAYFLLEGILRPVVEFDSVYHQSLIALNAGGIARLPGKIYINNFIFFPRGTPAYARVNAYLSS